MRTVREKVMRKSQNKTRKTVRQVANEVEDLTQQVLGVHRGLQVLLAEMNLVSSLVLNDLKERGKLRQVNCPSCENLNNIPLVAGMEVDELICRFCNGDLEPKEEE